MEFKKVIIDQFDPSFVTPLIEFGNSLSQINADFLIFMARKSLCLYDVLIHLGITPIEKCVLSDRVLDMRLDHFKQKKIALIDDTLILGSTLHKSKKLLQNIAREVTVHVFSVNKKWWKKEVIQPDSVMVELDDDRVMTFCTEEVRALSLLPRPYIADFPISKPFTIKKSELKLLLTNIDWISYRISTDLQRRNGVNAYSYFPSDEIILEINDSIGQQINDCIEMIKIRVFTRERQNDYLVTLVPIVTLKPLKQASLNLLINHFIDKISTISDGDLSKITTFTVTPQSQQRLSQFILSLALGERFINSLKSLIQLPSNVVFDGKETDRHYGPWLHNEMAEIQKNAFQALLAPDNLANGTIKIRPVDIHPVDIHPADKKSCLASLIDCKATFGRMPDTKEVTKKKVIEFFAETTEIFLHLFNTREIPAREEVHRLGVKAIDGPPEQAPNRDRLDVGIPWNYIANYLMKLKKISPSQVIKNLLTLILDLCNDLGIAVPVTCFRNGIVFRGYRHGEDVKFTEGEIGLAYEAIKGLLISTNRESIARLTLEKLLVLLIKIGAERRFLEPLFGPSGIEGIASIKFDLMGAVPILTRGPRERADRKIWLSRYLLKRRVIKRNPQGLYILGAPIEGNYSNPAAPHLSFELGRILGLLLRSTKDPERNTAPLDDSALIILASCGNPRHVAAAVEAELDIFKEWYAQNGRSFFMDIKWDDAQSLRNGHKYLVQSKGYQAIYGARLKFIAYKFNLIASIIDDCERYLETQLRGDFLSRTWRSYWGDIKHNYQVGEKRKFDAIIDGMAIVCWEIQLSLSAIEIAICCKNIAIGDNKNTRVPTSVFKKITSFNDSFMATKLQQSPFIVKSYKRIKEIEKSGNLTFEFGKAFDFGLKSIEERIIPIENLQDIVDPLIETYGRLQDERHKYVYMLFYDIKDSTGTIAGRTGHDLEIYRPYVRKFKESVNNVFNRLSSHANIKNCEIYCWNGDKVSSDDSKHVFIKGNDSLNYLELVAGTLINAASSWDLNIRIHIVPCNFAGTGAYRRREGTEITGERFWEHYSRLAKICSAYEGEYINKYSFIVIAGEELAQNFKLPFRTGWVDRKEITVSTEIELLSKITKICYGGIRMSSTD